MSLINNPQHAGRPLLIRGGGVITMDHQLGDIDRGDILVKDGKIVDIAPQISATDVDIIEAERMIVMPGFIDGHRHLWEGIARAALPVEDLNGYFQRLYYGLAPVISAGDAYLGTLVGALGALDAGITTVFDWAHIQTTPEHTAATISALREAGGRAVFGYGMSPAEDRGHQWPQDVLRLAKEDFSSSDQLLTLALATVSPEHIPEAVFRTHLAMAREAGVITSIHAGMFGMGAPGVIAGFEKQGLFGPDVNLVHCNTFSAEEWRLIAASGTSTCITPQVEMQMGHGVPPIQAARDAGVKPALGIDVETTVPGDMWTQMRVLYALQRCNAFVQMRTGGPAPSMMDPQEVLEYATMAGAVSIRLDHKIGSLAIGKAADIILLRTDLLNVMPAKNMKNAVVLNMDARNVDTVLVAGRIVKRDSRMLGVDMEGLRSRLIISRDRVFNAAGFAI